MKQKKVVIGLAASLLVMAAVLISSPTSFAEDKKTAKKTPALKCRAVTAVGHQPPQITPPAIKPPYKMRTFTLTTNCGDIVFVADGTKARLTVLAMTALAQGGYFDQTLCHRLTTSGIYVLQCGDPTASGSGGPTFTYRDENLPTNSENDYPAGIVAMANSGANTNGSQFFLVYQDTTLPPAYTRWGVITKGLDILRAIAAQGTANGSGDGAPKQPIAIERVKVR